ncbi:CBM35 domain-containing protein [Aliagarivorans taiwanensis]|uniref:CBM35 domain-containing protein n=1 Tax=Aliagarivorans taiwanensis TaxID=561966 RepID=UPI000405830A|nr:CBM35 domain-containing protein [Aliagarivorans taiwanensis]
MNRQRRYPLSALVMLTLGLSAHNASADCSSPGAGCYVNDSTNSNYLDFLDTTPWVDSSQYINQQQQSHNFPGYGDLYDHEVYGRSQFENVGIVWAGWHPDHYGTGQNAAHKWATIDEYNIKRVSFIPTYFITSYEEGIYCEHENTPTVADQVYSLSELLKRDVRVNYRPHIDPIRFTDEGLFGSSYRPGIDPNPGAKWWRGEFDELDPMASDYLCVIDQGLQIVAQSLAQATLPLAEPIRFDLGAELMDSTKNFPHRWAELVDYVRSQIAADPLLAENVILSHNFSHHVMYLAELEQHAQWFSRIALNQPLGENNKQLLFVDEMNAQQRSDLADYIKALDSITVSQYMPLDVYEPISADQHNSTDVSVTPEQVKDALQQHEQNFLQKVLMGKLGLAQVDIPAFHLGEYGMGIKGLIAPNVWDRVNNPAEDLISYDAHQVHARIAIDGLMLYMQDSQTVAKSLLIWKGGPPYDLIEFYEGDGAGMDVGDAGHGYPGKKPYNPQAATSLYNYWHGEATTTPEPCSVNCLSLTLGISDAVLSGGAEDLGNGYADLKHGSVMWNVDLPENASYKVTFVYGGNDGDKPNTLVIGDRQESYTMQQGLGQDVSIERTVTLGAGNTGFGITADNGGWGYVFVKSVTIEQLTGGGNTGGGDNGGDNSGGDNGGDNSGGDNGGDNGGCTDNCTTPPPVGDSIDLSANDATLSGGASLDGDYVLLQGAGSSGIWEFDLQSAGEYQITLHYTTGTNGYKENHLVINNQATKMGFEASGDNSYSTTTQLDAGVNRIGVEVRSGDWGYMWLKGISVALLGGLEITSPANLTQLPSGSDIEIHFNKAGQQALVYSLNGGAAINYQGESPLVIANQGDGIYSFNFGLEGSSISMPLRVTVGEQVQSGFVTTNGSQFWLDGKPFYFNGTNQYYLMYKPEQMAEDFFKRVAHTGMNAVRTWMFCNDTKTHDGVCINMKVGNDFILSMDPAQRSAEQQAIIDRSFELFDNYVALAEQYDVKLVLSLADHWNYFGNIDGYGGYTNVAGREQFKRFITNLFNHTNQLTGNKYNEDPTIMMWELANEPRINGDLQGFYGWVDDIANHIREQAPQQLISIGMESSFGHAGSGDDYDNLKYVNDHPNIDAISAHLYPTWWSMTDQESLDNFDYLAQLARELDKPGYIGEFSWPANVIRQEGNPSGSTTGTIEQGLAKRTEMFARWYEKAWSLQDAIGGVLGWQLSGLEWGNGSGSVGSCQWCSGPYGVFTGGWTANNDGFQYYCVVNDGEYSITGIGAPGNNVEGDTINLHLHEPVCDIVKDYSLQYRALME